MAQHASSLFNSQHEQDVLISCVSMHQHCAPLQTPKISSTRNWMLLLATFPKQNNCTYWKILMQEWEPIMKHGLHVLDTMAWGKMNEMARDFLSSAAIMDCRPLNKPCHKVSWRHPRSGHWHQLDLVITRRDALNNVLNSRSYHSADCDTDHSLICARLIMQRKRLFHSKQKGHNYRYQHQ